MAVQAKCPGCQRVYSVADDLVGKKIRCKGCAEVFEIRTPATAKPGAASKPAAPPAETAVQASKPKAVKAVKVDPDDAPPRKRRDTDDEEDDRPRKRRETVDEDEDDDRPRKRRDADDEDAEDDDRPRKRRKGKKKAGSNAAVLWALGIGGGLVVLVILGVTITLLMMRGSGQQGNPVALVPPPVAPAGGGGANPAAGMVGGAGANGAAGGAPAAGGANPAGGGAQGVAPPGLYGDQGGDPVAPADPGLPDTILRARADDTFYRLSNPRVGSPSRPFPGQALLVDYQVVRRGKYNGSTLVIHSGDGSRQPVNLMFFGPPQDRGTFELTTFGPFGNFPKNAELYMTNGDHRYGPHAPTFKVSNSVVMGSMSIQTKARNWTAQEIARYTKDPPNHTAANVHPTVGKDTDFVGDAKGGFGMRFVEPAGHLLGLEYRLGEWDKEKCVGGVTAVFRREQEPTGGLTRVMAKDGYAVGGAEIHSKRFVNAIRLKFMRVKPDGGLDKADAYTSDWIGEPGEGAPRTLVDDGRKVLGIHYKQGAIINALALVADKAAGAK